MSAVSERKRLRSFADVALHAVAPSGDAQEFNQLTFEGVEVEKKEVEIDNCKIVKQPVLRKAESGSVWGCTVEYQQDLWHQEDYGSFVLHATQNAEKAAALKLKVNDIILVHGAPWVQYIPLRGGNMKTINHVNVTDIEIVSRAPRGAGVRRQQ